MFIWVYWVKYWVYVYMGILKIKVDFYSKINIWVYWVKYWVYVYMGILGEVLGICLYGYIG